MSRNECVHGFLARSCETCDLETRIDELQDRLATLTDGILNLPHDGMCATRYEGMGECDCPITAALRLLVPAPDLGQEA